MVAFMPSKSWPLLLVLVVPAAPYAPPKPADPDAVVYGESSASRTVYTVVSMICLGILTGMVGYRARQLEKRHLRDLNLTRVLVLVLYILAISFVTSAAVVESGLGLSSPTVCHAAIIICLVFYVGGKITMYVFLVERVHAIRAPYMRRTSDWIWLSGMTVIAIGFGSIAIAGFIWPIADMSVNDGRCRIGLPFKVSIPLLTFDVIINTALTAVFVYLLRPLLRFGSDCSSSDRAGRFAKGFRRLFSIAEDHQQTGLYPVNPTLQKSIGALLRKTLFGSLLVMLPTVGNLAALYSLKGRELGWLCLTVCTFDVTWAVGVIHWLTIGSTEVEESSRALAMLVQDSASNSSTGPTYPL